jgi:alpha-L-fucosidase
MFIHWGLYACMDGNEWVMHNKAYTHEEYRVQGEDPENGFTADRFNPTEWARLAKKAGMKYMVLTSRHHDGYALFNTQHPQGWSSVTHLGRDLLQEYTSAVQEEGLRVGVYYSPMSWRYPGYYNVTGDDMKPNKWGYTAEPWHKENARVMKEEVYEQLKNLLTKYGKIDYLWWDGAWLGQTIGHEIEDLFWDTGRYQNRDGAGLKWIIDEQYVDRDEEGLVLGVMGMVRKYQPTALTNERFSWIGDIHIEEGGATPAGDVRTERLSEKCTSLQKGGWGYWEGRPLYPANDMITVLSGCAVRNANFLLNIAPDRHGEIPADQQAVLLEIGRWLEKNGEGIYHTRGGPWQPLFGEYGFTYRDNKIYCHVYSGYRHTKDGIFTTHSIGDRKVTGVRALASGKELEWTKNGNGTITIRGIQYAQDPPVTILEATLEQNLYHE